MNKLIKQFCFILLIVFTLHSYTNAYDEVFTHKDITEVAAFEKSNLKNYLINNLGISKGLDTKINGKEIINWLRDSSKDEDLPWCRASNHFHDPTVEQWQQAGLTDQNWWINLRCSVTPYPPDNITSNII